MNKNKYVDINAHDNYPDSKQKIEIPPMKVISLKKICMTIGELPTSYLESMTYYEMLVWFINYLRDNIIPTVNGNGEAVEELQNVVMSLQNYINSYKDSIDADVEELEDYMNNYFENLDVQEEINNKLDEMLKDGVLEQIIEQFIQSNALWCFDNVQSMKESNNLIDGSFAKTLGYYNINDGGNAEYIIVDDDTLVDDGGSILTLNNGLKAKLIIKDSINIKQFGCKGNSENDDTTAFQSAIDYLENEVINSDLIYKAKTLILDNGEYKLTDTINLSPLVKIRTNGQVVLNSYVNNKPLLYLNPELNTLIENYNLDQITYFGEYINGEDGLFIYNNDSTNDSIALKIGTEDTGELKKRVAHTIIKNITINNFKVGILLTMHNVYCNTFENINILRCHTDVQVGLPNENGFNSGERMTFTGCQFGASVNNDSCFNFYQTGFFYFNNCSFDYARCFFKDSSAEKTMISIFIDNCHIEASNRNIENLNEPYGIVYGYFKYGDICINNTVVYVVNKYPIFSCGTNDSKPQHSKYILSLKNVQFVSGPEIDTDVEYQYLVKGNVNINVDNVNIGKLENYGRFLNEETNIIRENTFNSMTTGNITLSNYDTTLGSNNLNYKVDIKDSASIITNSINGKNCLKMLSSGSNPRCSLTTDYIEVQPYKTIFASSWTKGFYIQRVQFSFYDDSKNLISQSSTTATANIEHDLTIPYNYSGLKKDITPKGCRYVKVRYYWENTGGTHTFTEDSELLIGELKCFIS